MGAGGDFGHDAAVGCVEAVLAKDLGGEKPAGSLARYGAQDRGRGVVAAALEAEDDAGRVHASPGAASAPGWRDA